MTTKTKTTETLKDITVTVQGLEITVSPTVADDYEFLEAIADSQTDLALLPGIMRKLLGDKHEAMKEHLRKQKGYVSIQAIDEFAKELFVEIEKNSPNSQGSSSQE